MKTSKSSFFENYKKKINDIPEMVRIQEAIYLAFDLTDEYGVIKINKAIAESAIKFNINEDVLREKINDTDFILNERKHNE
tara:strand:- start:511 stop:753 length:243 start_codon:yes stop_codon:yes gene_type:complete